MSVSLIRISNINEKLKLNFFGFFFVHLDPMQEFNSPSSRTMSAFNGDNLLNVFKDLHVQLLNLSPNVIKGWFDTDDDNMKSLLKWMCTALSSDNFLSPLENAE